MDIVVHASVPNGCGQAANFDRTCSRLLEAEQEQQHEAIKEVFFIFSKTRWSVQAVLLNAVCWFLRQITSSAD